jgi:hypothetical protein
VVEKCLPGAYAPSVDEIRLAGEINFTLSHFALVQFILRVLIRRGDFVAP